MRTQDVLNIPSIVVVPGTLVVCVFSNNLRRDKKNSLLTDNSATCKAIISALSKAYGLAGRAPNDEHGVPKRWDAAAGEYVVAAE